MAIYALGDLHGCFSTLEALFARLPFDEERDELWLVGDLVNRGPESLATLRWARAWAIRLGGRFRAVLGNHDVHLLAQAAGLRKPKASDTLDAVLEAPDRDELLAWMRALPLVVERHGRLLVHAGLFPEWSAGEALQRSREVERLLATDDGLATLLRPDARQHALARRALYSFTRLRTCTPEGEPCDFTGPPGEAPPGCLPWFEVPGRASADTEIVCGHWAALGRYLGERVMALDSGVVWGGPLTAVRLDDRALFSQPNRR